MQNLNLLVQNQKADLLARYILTEKLGTVDASRVVSALLAVDDITKRELLCRDMVNAASKIGQASTKDLREILNTRNYQDIPAVSVRQFVEDPYFMNAKGILFPLVLSELEAMNNGEYQEAVLTGAIGTGKTTLALYTTAYQLYLLSCCSNPHAKFGLDPSSEIMFVIQSISAALAKSVDFARLKAMIQKSPYFQEHYAFDKHYLSELRFPNRVVVAPVSGSETGAIGKNVIGGIIDEMNFMALVESSKQNRDGSTYDQAISLYNSIARRRKSRFMSHGKLPGLLCLVSSKRYPGQFTDLKEEEALREIEREGKTSIYVYDKRTWDIKPEGSFSGVWFTVFIGDSGRQPRIIPSGEQVNFEDMHLVVDIPEEYRNEFETDMAGISTLARHPFIPDRDAIARSMRTDSVILSRNTVDFVDTQLLIYKKHIKYKDQPRFVHIDLAVSGDSAGVCVGCVRGFKIIKVGDVSELMPDIWIDVALEVKPPKSGEIQFHKIRSLLYALTASGIPIKWVSFDQFQSVDSMQILKQKNYVVGRQSVDITTAPYDFVKNALYQGRLSIPKHEKLEIELASLEKDVKRNKVDHPVHSSKDISDALAGVVYGLTLRKDVWVQHGIPLGSIPASLIEAISKKNEYKPLD